MPDLQSRKYHCRFSNSKGTTAVQPTKLCARILFKRVPLPRLQRQADQPCAVAQRTPGLRGPVVCTVEYLQLPQPGAYTRQQLLCTR